MKDKISTPLILVNFKTYHESLGKHSTNLAKAAQDVAREKDISIGIAPQYVDLKSLCENFDIPVFAQHVDAYDPGAHTGHVTMESIRKVGATGVIINHSERRIRLSDISMIVEKARKLDLISVVCADTPTVSAAVAALKPDLVAIEPPELIGSGIAVSTAKPKIILDTVSLIKKTNPNVIPLCGAGITKGDDVTAALKLGTQGILVASGIVKAKRPAEALVDLAEGSKR